jgi:hypothetical protein
LFSLFGRGGFYEQYLITTNNLHKPAPTQQIAHINFYLYQMRKMYIGIYGWARAGFRDCPLLAHIVGETRPYQIRQMYIGIYRWARAGFRDCQLLAHIIGETRPYQITFTKLATC